MKTASKILAVLLAVSLSVSTTGCVTKEIIKSDNTTNELSSITNSSQESEYPSSNPQSENHSSSSDVSSIISQIVSSQNSQKPQHFNINNSSNSNSNSNSNSTTTSRPSSSESSKTPSENQVKPKPPTPQTPPTPKPPTPSEPENNTNYKTMKAVWISFLEFDSFRGSTKEVFTNRVKSYFDKSKQKGLNTVIVQVRAHGDSFFESKNYPWSRHVSGAIGKALSYDPMEIMVKEAHARGLSFHAWINPYRTMTDSEFKSVNSSYKTKQWYTGADNKYMIKHTDGRWWLKPGNPEVQKLIVDGAKEIAQKYPIDGVHIDDYFYATDPSTYGDTQAQAKANTTAMVKGLYSGLKSINPKCLFGVSPAGGFGKSQSLPDSDRKYLSTDLKKWCQNAGYIDYVIPQIYWDYNHDTAGYGMVLNKWKDFVTSPSVELYSGIAAYKVNTNGIKKESIPKQIADSMNGKANGYAIYRFDHLDDY